MAERFDMGARLTTAPRIPSAAAYQIRARVRTDDNQISVKFDAVGWFTQATDADVRALHAERFRGDAADAVVYYCDANIGEAKRSPLAGVFRYLTTYKPRKGDLTIIGYECTLDPLDVAVWLDANRPGLRLELFPEYVPPATAAGELVAC